MSYTLTLSGNTFGIKEELKAAGFRWNAMVKAWAKSFDDKQAAVVTGGKYSKNGVNGTIKETASKEKRYMVKEDWIFNLESMHDKLFVIELDLREDKLQFPFEVAGKTIKDYDDLDALANEAAELEYKAKSNRGVTGKEYGRIKEIVSWRVMQRYARCMASGMDEKDAARCFEDM